MSRPEAEHQLQRVLAMIPWLASRPGVHKDEVAARFRITRDELERDLGLIMMVGVPPYTPGDYINVSYEDDTVELWLADYFKRPLQLSPAEGLALLAGGRALLAVEGSDPEGPLATALVKLEDALGVSEVAVEFGAPALLAELRQAAAEGERVEIDYWSAGRDEVTTRRIDPGAPFFALGRWYTDAYCHKREDQRMFRVDRIRALRATGEHFDADGGPVPEVLYVPRPGDPRVTLELPAGASWVAESFPAESVEDLPGGGQRVVLAVSEPAWLDRILLRVGAGARVLDPPALRDAGRIAARRVLARYRT